MLRYVFKRIMIFVPTFFIISVLIFGLSKAAPGDPVEILLEGGMGSASTGSSADFANKERAYAQKAAELGLDKPAFYVQLSSAAYPKDLYKIQKKTQHEMVERMIDRTGNAVAVMAYFKAIRQLTARSIELTHTSYQRKLYVRQRVEELLVEYDTGAVNFRIDTLSTLLARDTVLFAQLGPDWAAVLTAYKAMCTQKQRYKLYIPSLHFNGLDNQYHVWMFGDYPWFSTVDSSAYHKRVALSDSIRGYRSEEREINRRIRSAKRLIGAQMQADTAVDSLALQQVEKELSILKIQIDAAFEYREKLTEEMPKYVSKGFLRGDFGISYADGKPVSLKLKSALFWTLIMNLIAIFISYLLSIPLGIQSALWKLRGEVKRDNLVTGLLFVLYSMPAFWIGTLLLVFFTTPEYGEWLDWFPSGGAQSTAIEQDPDATFFVKLKDSAHHLVLPIFCLTYGSLAYLSRQMRTAMLGVVKQDYIRTARAKGLPAYLIIWKHAFRNALFPIITLFSTVFPRALSGAITIELIYSIPGMGLLVLNSIYARDWPVVFAVVMLSAILAMIGNLVADMLYAITDPRVRYD